MNTSQSGGSASRLPDFIIGGAPKCGTTSLHFVLKQHPDVGIPDNEILYYDADDPVVHADFLHVSDGALAWFDPLGDRQAVDWYASRFAPFADRPRIGEDSPTYLFSEVAARRIAQHAPESRLIFSLRHPIARAYSQYWHLVKSGRATASFEKTLISDPSILLGSTYTSNLQRFIDIHGRDRVHIVIFEDFAQDSQTVIDGVTDFLGIDRMTVGASSRFNRTSYPRSEIGQRMVNRIGRHVVAQRYRNHMSQDSSRWRRAVDKFHYRWFRYINPIFLGADKPPQMQPATRRFLETHLSARNAGLSDLLGRDMTVVWPGMSV